MNEDKTTKNLLSIKASSQRSADFMRNSSKRYKSSVLKAFRDFRHDQKRIKEYKGTTDVLRQMSNYTDASFTEVKDELYPHLKRIWSDEVVGDKENYAVIFEFIERFMNDVAQEYLDRLNVLAHLKNINSSLDSFSERYVSRHTLKYNFNKAKLMKGDDAKTVLKVSTLSENGVYQSEGNNPITLVLQKVKKEGFKLIIKIDNRYCTHDNFNIEYGIFDLKLLYILTTNKTRSDLSLNKFQPIYHVAENKDPITTQVDGILISQPYKYEDDFEDQVFYKKDASVIEPFISKVSLFIENVLDKKH